MIYSHIASDIRSFCQWHTKYIQPLAHSQHTTNGVLSTQQEALLQKKERKKENAQHPVMSSKHTASGKLY